MAKRCAYLLLFCTLSLPLCPGFSADGKAKKILQHHLTFIGGRKKISAIRSIQFQNTRSGFLKSTYTFGFPGLFRHRVKANHGSLHFLAVKKQAWILDLNVRGKVTRKQTLSKNNRKELRYYARELIFPLILPLEKKISRWTFHGVKKISAGLLKGRRVVELSLVLKSGEKYQAYFSKNYKFLIMIRSVLPYGKQKNKIRTVLYEDYREIKGVMIPHKIYMQTQGSSRKKLKLKVKINPKLSEKFWDTPQGKGKEK